LPMTDQVNNFGTFWFIHARSIANKKSAHSKTGALAQPY
jgi:hypothetical protein